MSNRITGGMIAPQQQSSGSKVREDLELLEEGLHQAILIGLVDLGTHLESFNNEDEKERRKILCILEYPELKQLVYEDDTEKRSYIKYETMTWSFFKNAGFLKLISAVNNGQFAETEFSKIDLFQFVGQRLYTSIKHVQKEKSGIVNTYVNVETYARIGKAPAPENFISDGNRYMFYIDPAGNNFMTENFAELPKFAKDKIKESLEGKAYIERGGKFLERNEEDKKPKTSSTATPPPAPTENVPEGYTFVDTTGNDGTYEDYKNNGWKDNQLIKHGFLVEIPKKLPTAPPPPEDDEKTPTKKIASPPSDESSPKEQGGEFNPFNDDDDDLPY